MGDWHSGTEFASTPFFLIKIYSFARRICRVFHYYAERCVVFGCNNTASSEKGISLYRIPYWCDNRNEVKSRRKKWLDFVRHKRDQWNPSCSSVICSVHFTEDCFEYGSDTVERYKTPKLRRDEIGITAEPSVLSTTACIDSEHTLHMQRRGKVCNL